MDTGMFDSLTRALADLATRRRLLGVLAATPLAGGLLAGEADDGEAKDRRRRRKHRHKRRKNPGSRKGKGCKPKSRATVCAGRCGEVRNRLSCGKRVDCGPCPCDPPCDACFSCDAATRTCVSQCAGSDTCCAGDCADLETDANHCGACGNACGDGQVCQGGVCGVACGSDFCPAATEICVDAVCEVCDVTCSGSATACREALEDALANVSLATVHVCPGTYEGGFSIERTVTVIGAGEGEDPASNTVLDGGETQIVLLVTDGAVALRQVRVTRGEAGEDGGGGISSSASSLTMQDCTVIDNRGRLGGGIGQVIGPLTMTRCTLRDNIAQGTDAGFASGGGLRLAANATLTDCLIEDNTTDGSGGGINIQPNRSLTLAGTTRIAGNTAVQGGGIMVNINAAIIIGEACRITGNTASAGNGGGIATFGTVTLQGTENPSPIVVDNCAENCVGGVPKCQPEGTCPAP